MEGQLPVVPMPIRLVVGGDDPLVVARVEELLRREADFEVIARRGKEETILFALRAFRPDVLVFDPPATSAEQGLALLRQMRAAGLATRAVLLSPPLPEDQLREAVRLGVGGIVRKDAAPAVLVECIRSVNAGIAWLGDRLPEPSPATAQDPDATDATLRKQRRALTSREVEVVRLVCVGLRNKEIATKLELTEGTVKTHLHRIYDKLTVRGRLELSLYCRNKSL